MSDNTAIVILFAILMLTMGAMAVASGEWLRFSQARFECVGTGK